MNRQARMRAFGAVMVFAPFAGAMLSSAERSAAEWFGGIGLLVVFIASLVIDRKIGPGKPPALRWLFIALPGLAYAAATWLTLRLYIGLVPSLLCAAASVFVLLISIGIAGGLALGPGQAAKRLDPRVRPKRRSGTPA